MNIVPKLNLNKHPKDCENLSLVSAKNVRVADDMSCLTNEEGVITRGQFNADLASDFKSDWDILGYIPCNNEVVLFIRGTWRGETEPRDFIYRYDEKEDSVLCANDKWKWSGGKIKGTFTYNVENDLIIAIAEYGVEGEDIPLKTINLGKFGEDSYDVELEDKYYAISPEVKIPSFSYVNYIAGSCYKGWYYLFIRYKINKVDYTQWFGFGYPIFIDTLERTQIFRYAFGLEPGYTGGTAAPILSDWPSDGYATGATDDFSSTSDVASETFEAVINMTDIVGVYDYYQIGIICASKSYTKSWRTSDIKLIDNIESTFKTQSFIFDIQQLIEIDIASFTEENYNYFNVKNIINYKNRLYISNYKEHALNNKNIPQDILDNISIRLYKNDSWMYGPTLDNNLKFCFIYYNNKGTVPLQYFVPYNRTGSNSITLNQFLHLPSGSIRKVCIENNAYANIDLDKILLRTTESSIPSKVEFYDTINKKSGVVITVYMDPNSNDTAYKVDVSNWLLAMREVVYGNSDSFENRRQRTTLIPNEVYNFFIHFVDKYGHVTNGYRIENKKTYIDPITKVPSIPIPYSSVQQQQDASIYYKLVPEDTTFDNLLDAITDNTVYIASAASAGIYDIDLANPLNGYGVSDIKISINKYYNSFISNPDYSNLKIYQVINTGIGENFGIYINNNKERLWRIPKDKFNYDKNMPYFYHSFFTYGIYVNVPKLPDGYIGWFISYEKFEPLQRVTGFLTRNDFRTVSKIKNSNNVIVARQETINIRHSGNMYLYSSKFDISDSLKFDYNVLEIELKNGFTDEIHYYDMIQRNATINYPIDLNKKLYDFSGIPQTIEYQPTGTPIKGSGSKSSMSYAMPKFELVIADSAKGDRLGLGTALRLEDNIGLFDYTSSNDEDINVYLATLYNYTLNIYMSKNKELIRMTDIQYTTGEKLFLNGLPGHITYDGVLIYENPGTIFNTTDYSIKRLRGVQSNYITTKFGGEHRVYDNIIPFVNYVQFPCYDTYFYESKRFNNTPQPYVFPVNKPSSSPTKSWGGSMIEPKNSIDLFSNPQGSADDFNIKIFTNYREEILSVEEYNKTIRRSNVIQDESRVNAWRTFPVEGYKNITENKGIITNIIGIGTYLLVHTEHSLFMFNTDNTLKTQDKDIQLSQPDAFEVNYTEVFTSDFGYGGLQDDKAFVVDQFGYIFYNNDFNHFYQFDNGQLKVIDADIIQFLNKFKPINIRIGNDKLHNRLLIKMDIPTDAVTQKSEVISYHYDLGNFISLHDYYFEEAFNTKTQIYLLRKDGWENLNNKVNLYFFDDKRNYGFIHDTLINTNSFSESYKSNTRDTYKSFISIIINSEYQVIKLIEFLKYNLRKIKKDTTAFTISPVEEMKVPYSGDLIRIFNDQCDSGDLDVSVTEYNPGDYTKPWYELGNWNFNYFRNNINNLTSNNGDVYTRLFGNYFVVRFIFNNDDNLRIEFEEVDGSVVKNRKL